jgi:hypothetical protein
MCWVTLRCKYAACQVMTHSPEKQGLTQLPNTSVKLHCVCATGWLQQEPSERYKSYDSDPYLLVQTEYLHDAWVQGDSPMRCNAFRTLYAHACMIKIVSALCSMVENQQVMSVKQVTAMCQPHNGLQVLLKVGDRLC